MKNTSLLVDILRTKRPHGCDGIETLCDRLFEGKDAKIISDDKGTPLAVMLVQGTSETLFSCHLDTVHRTEGEQILVMDEDEKLISKMPNSKECLGADDGAGIWLLLSMFEYGIPGTYLFHYGEEKGGIGSSGIADQHVEFLKGFKRAVAFDRRGTTSVITHQGCGRCCSDTFANALCDQLNAAGVGLAMVPDDGGTFTDTANYIEHIAECTNISCGYESEHTAQEMLDYGYLFDLLDALITVDWENLPVEREPGRNPSRWDAWDFEYGRRYGLSLGVTYEDDAEKLIRMGYFGVKSWVERNRFDPERIADAIYTLACELEEYRYTEERSHG